MSSNPRTTTFLFTDLESSTPLWENHPALMESLAARHDALLQKAIEAHRGQVVKTTGDGFLAVFDTASDGIAAALTGQRALIAESWPDETGPLQVRMGLHTGESQERGGDHFGSEVNRAARVMSLAYGGQILVSQATAALVRTVLPEDVTLSDLGQHQLKGLKDVEQIYQLCHLDLPADFPPLKSLSADKHNLPTGTTPFVGRREELISLSRLLADPDVKIVTILGPGGMGKTRLAVEAAREQVGSFSDGVYFIDLASIDEAQFISSHIAETLGFNFHLRHKREDWTQDTQVEQLLAYLKKRQLLLLLDNCEHLLKSALAYGSSSARSIDQFAAVIIQTAPQVRILATSQEKLNLHGETVLPLDGLDLPATTSIDLIDAPDPAAAGAIQLFRHGGRRVQPDFELGPNNLGKVVDICRLVGGMPLAIELAAAWVELLSPSEIATEIRNSLEILETDLGDIPDRQRSVRAVFESTWGRLEPVEQEAYQQLSVFRGGFTREAAQAVAGTSLRTLMALLNKSLLRPVAEGRYQLHELLRQLVAERLSEDPIVEAAVKDRHCSYYSTFLLRAEPELGGLNSSKALTDIEVEFDNVRSAWRWAVAQEKFEEIAKAMESLCEFLRVRGRLNEPGEFFQPAAKALGWKGYGDREDNPDSDALFEETVQLLNASQAGNKSDDERKLLLGKVLARDNRHWCESPSSHWAASQVRRQSLGLLSQFGERLEIAWLLRYGAHVLLKPWHSKALYEQALTIFEEFGDERGIAGAHLQLGVMAIRLGDYREAEHLFQDMLTRAQELEDRESTMDCLGLLGHVHWALGKYGSAREFCNKSISLSMEIGYPSQTAWNQRILARIALSQGDHQAAERYLQEVLDIYEELGLRGLKAEALSDLGHILASMGNYPTAVQLAEESLRICREQEHRYGVIGPYTLLGEAALGMSDLESAAKYFRRAIQTADDTCRPSKGHHHHALAGLARLLAAQGNIEGAYALGNFVLNNPASWQWSKDIAADLLAKLEVELSPESISAAREWGKEKQFEEVASYYLSTETIGESSSMLS